MSRIALVRHGETDWNRDGRLQGRADVPLNDTGRRQAAELAPLLAGGSWVVVLSSPLVRATETAEILAAAAGLSTGAPVADLVERSYGEAEGLTAAEAERRWPDGAWPGLEGLDALAERGVTALERLAEALAPADLAVVAHGALIRAVASRLGGVPVPRILNGACTLLEHDGRAWVLRGANLTTAAPPGPGPAAMASVLC